MRRKNLVRNLVIRWANERGARRVRQIEQDLSDIYEDLPGVGDAAGEERAIAVSRLVDAGITNPLFTAFGVLGATLVLAAAGAEPGAAFYSTTAQVIPLLMVVLAVEGDLVPRMLRMRTFRSAARNLIGLLVLGEAVAVAGTAFAEPPAFLFPVAAASAAGGFHAVVSISLTTISPLPVPHGSAPLPGTDDPTPRPSARD